MSLLRYFAFDKPKVVRDQGNAWVYRPTVNEFLILISAGVETRSLGAPVYPGQEVWIAMQTDGGDCQITAPTAFNAAGNDRITFTAVGQMVKLTAGLVGGGASPLLRWLLVLNVGTTLSTSV